MAKLRQGTVITFLGVLCVTAALTASAADHYESPPGVDGHVIEQAEESPSFEVEETVEESLHSLFSMTDERLTLQQVALKLPAVQGNAREAMIDTMQGIKACMKYATLPRKYVSVSVDTADEVNWSLFSLRLSRRREDALRDLATAVAQIDDLFYAVCPDLLVKRKGLVKKNVLSYAEQLIRAGVHKAMLRALEDRDMLGGDEELVPGLFNAAQDVRKNPKRLRALEKLLHAPSLFQQKKERLASVLESSVTSDLVFLQRLNAIRSDETARSRVYNDVSKLRAPVLSMIMRNRYPTINRLVEEATDLAFEGLLTVPPPSVESDGNPSPGTQPGLLRANETLPCIAMDFQSFGRFRGAGSTVYVWKYREQQNIHDITASEWSTFLSKMDRELYTSDPELAKRIEMVRPFCYKKLKRAPFPREQMVAVSTAPVREFQKLLEQYNKLNNVGLPGVQHSSTAMVMPEGAAAYSERSSRRVAVAVPRTWSTQLTRAGILKFLRNVGLAVVAVGAIGIGFFLTICAAGFMSGGVGSLVSCAAGAAIAGTAAVFVVSPGISLGFAGLVGISSTLLWRSRVHSGMSLAMRNATRLYATQNFTDLESRLAQQ